ncbi:MAG TPA: VTT domain-containing protein [Terriglobales bacterium]|nr:VTT domain-containing protein [Terriglobales bacterium]
MNHFFSSIAPHGYLLVFVFVLADALGLPLPAALVLLPAGAAVALGTLNGSLVLLVAMAGFLTGDILLFVLGRSMGWTLLGVLCRVSLNPETCILRSAELFYKRGKVAVLLAKFIPGMNTMAAPLAGSMKMRFRQFLGLDSAAALLYVVLYAGLGFLFRDFLAMIIRSFQRAGHVFADVLLAAAVLYVVYRLRLYRKSKVYEIVPRVPVREVAARLESEEKGRIFIVDVRSHGYYDAGAQRIRGSIRLEPNQLVEEIRNLPRDKDIYLYCT